MKKIDESLNKEYLPVILKLENLEELEKIFRENTQLRSMKSDGYEFNSIQELAEHFGDVRIRKIRFEASEPYMYINFDNFEASLYVSSSTTTATGIFYQLDRVISRCQRRGRWAYSFLAFCSVNIIMSIVSTQIPSENPLKPYVSVIMMSFLLWFIWMTFVRLGRHSTIYIRRYTEEKSFWVRNQDQLAIAVIAAVLGMLLGIVGTLTTKKITESLATKTETAVQAPLPSATPTVVRQESSRSNKD